MSKFLEYVGVQSLWYKVKTLIDSKADKAEVKLKADKGHRHEISGDYITGVLPAERIGGLTPGAVARNSVFPFDQSRIPYICAPRTAFANPSNVTVEYSQDSGSTWADSGMNDGQKANLFAPFNFNSRARLGNRQSGLPTNDDMLRITLKSSCNVIIDRFFLYVDTEGSVLEVMTEQHNISGDTWQGVNGWTRVEGWYGPNEIVLNSNIRFGYSSVDYIRFTFRQVVKSPNAAAVWNIVGYGPECQNDGGVAMRSTGLLYGVDGSQNATFPAQVLATSFRTINGNYNQVVVGTGQLRDVSSHTHTKSQITDFAHTHGVSDVSGLQAALSEKQGTIADLAAIRSGAGAGATAYQKPSAGIPKTDLAAALKAEIEGKAEASHTHEIANITGLQAALNGKAAGDHTHDERYYTESEVDAKLQGKQDAVADLGTIRSNAAAGAAKYAKPSDGIPESDLSAQVQTKLNNSPTVQIWTGTQAQYDALTTKDANTLYFCHE